MQGVKQRLDIEIAKLKLKEVTQASKEIMFAKQNILELSLAKLFSDEKGGTSLLDTIICKEGVKVSLISDKLQVFADYYEDRFAF